MDDQVFMDAEIRPNRSLSERGFIVLISIVTFLNCCSAAVFLSMGATFVPIFLGADVLAILVAFLANYASARQIERVQVTEREVRVIHETPKWRQVVWNSPTAFTRVSVQTEDDRTVGVTLALSGREAPVAAALGPNERAEFARALEGAIRQARNVRW